MSSKNIILYIPQQLHIHFLGTLPFHIRFPNPNSLQSPPRSAPHSHAKTQRDPIRPRTSNTPPKTLFLFWLAPIHINPRTSNTSNMKFPDPIDHVYILCDPKKEPDRAAYLTQWLAENRIDPTNYTMVLDTYGDDPFFQSKAVWDFYDPWSTAHGRKPLNFNTTNLKPTELSLIWNWASVARRATLAQHRVVLILESDVLFCPNFLHAFQISLAALETETGGAWDFLSLSASAAITPAQVHPGRLWYHPNNPTQPTRCTDSMVFRVPLLAKILDTLFPCAEALDWELNFQLTMHNARSYWLHPPVTMQGSGVTSAHVYPTRI
jgi:hypothetical protein